MAKNISKIQIPNVSEAYNVIDATAIHSEDVATSSKVGLVKIGSGITVAADGTISVSVSHPVTSVNSKTGAVVLSASDVGAIPAPATMSGNKYLKTNSDGTVTETDLPSASTGTKGVTYLVNAYNRTDTDKAVTAKALNDVYKMVTGLSDAMIFKGTLGTTADGATVTALPASHTAGWTYKVVTAGTYAGNICEVGDMIACINTRTTANNADWTVFQANIDGAVTGPTSSTDAHVATFNGATGKVIKDSGFTIASSVPANAKFTDTQLTEAQIANMGFTKNTGTYIKPSTGIPASDLASGVIPTKTSELTNDSGYITSKDIPDVPVTSVNSKTGAVTLNASDVGAVPTTRTVNSKALSSNITLSASDVGAVPTTRTVNGKALSANITLGASDVSAVPTTRTVNGKALSANVSLSASDVGALPDTTEIPDSTSDLTNDSGFITSSDIPTSLKNPNALTFTGSASGSYDGSSAKTVNIPTVPTSLKNPNALKFTGASTASYDGSSAVTINIPSASGTNIVVSKTQPTGQKAGDFWFQIVD